MYCKCMSANSTSYLYFVLIGQNTHSQCAQINEWMCVSDYLHEIIFSDINLFHKQGQAEDPNNIK